MVVPVLVVEGALGAVALGDAELRVGEAVQGLGGLAVFVAHDSSCRRRPLVDLAELSGVIMRNNVGGSRFGPAQVNPTIQAGESGCVVVVTLRTANQRNGGQEFST